MGSIPFLAAISNGVPLVLIAHLHGDPLRPDYSTGHSIVAGPGTGIGRGDIKALKGKRIALPRGTGAEGYVLGHLRSTGMAVEEVQLINVKPADLPTALARRDVDAIAVWEPWPSTALVKVPGSVRVVDGGCATCYIPAAILTNRDTVAKKAEALRRFMVAFAESQQWVRQNLRRGRRDHDALGSRHRPRGDEGGHPAGRLRSPDLKVHSGGLRQDDDPQSHVRRAGEDGLRSLAFHRPAVLPLRREELHRSSTRTCRRSPTASGSDPEGGARPLPDPRMARTKVQIRGLTIDYVNEDRGEHHRAIDSLSLDVYENEFLCVVGPSGCGKSTLIAAIAGFLRPAAGQLSMDGRRITGPGADRGVVFQEYALLPWKTVIDNVALGSEDPGCSSRRAARGRPSLSRDDESCRRRRRSIRTSCPAA